MVLTHLLTSGCRVWKVPSLQGAEFAGGAEVSGIRIQQHLKSKAKQGYADVSSVLTAQWKKEKCEIKLPSLPSGRNAPIISV